MQNDKSVSLEKTGGNISVFTTDCISNKCYGNMETQ